MNHTLWYHKPAEKFMEALPIGNGSFGAMVYGGVARETLTLNFDTFWSGCPREDEKTVEKAHLQTVKALVMAGKSAEAEALVKETLLGHYNESYMPFGTLWYEISDSAAGEGYRRTLDLERAEATMQTAQGDTAVRSVVFASYPDGCIAGRICLPDAWDGQVTFGFESELRHSLYSQKSDTLSLLLQAPSHVVPNYVDSGDPVQYDAANPGMKGVCTLLLRCHGGEKAAQSGQLVVRGTKEIEFYLVAADGYCGYGQPLEQNYAVLLRRNEARLDRLRAMTFETLRQRHAQDYATLYGRLRLSLCAQEPDCPTDMRLRSFQEGAQDNGLIELYCNYGRYLMIASSREGSQPSTLQGIWSESIRPVWSSNWTININTQMNYWLATVGNLLDCCEPLVRFVRELSESGAQTAQKQYACRGWVANHNVDLWRQTSPVGGEVHYAYWPMGGVWLTVQLYDYCRYRKNEEEMRACLLPLLQGCARFLLDWMEVGEDGLFYTPIATSPENRFLDENGVACCLSAMPAVDIALVRELFCDLQQACDELKVQDDLYHEVARALPLLPPFKVNEKGCLQEWNRDYRQADAGHRHFSPLLGYHPGWVINEYDCPELARAARATLEERIQNGSAGTGWSCAWAVNLWARMHQGENALAMLNRLLKRYTYANLFDIHPAIDINGEIFQIDGNFGGVAGVLGMLVQSRHGVIELLPALPNAWPQGSVAGVLVEEGFAVSLSWERGALKTASIAARCGGVLRLAEGARYRVCVAGKQLCPRQEPGAQPVAAFTVQAGDVCEITLA